MQAIRILADCLAAGEHQPAGRVLTIPGDIAEDEAVALVRIGRAEVAQVAESVTVPTKRRRKESV